MARTMYDSVTPSAIPTTAALVGGYLAPSPYAWSTEDWARFPSAVKVRIAVRASVNDGHVLDVEKGDATPAQAPAWAVARRAAGTDPTVYCNVSTWPAVQAAFAAAGVAQPHYWIAHYGAGPTIPAGAVAVQFVDPPGSGGDWDLSAVADHWPGVDPQPLQEVDMELTDTLPNGATVAQALIDGMTGQQGKWTAGPTGAWLAAQIQAIAGALSTEDAAILAAIHTLPAPVVQQITADPAAVAAALDAAGLPTALAAALLAALDKAAGGQPAAA